MFKIMIFGARSIALGICLAMQNLYKDLEIVGFLVSNKKENPDMLAGFPVYELGTFIDKKICVLIAVPEDMHGEVVALLEKQGFHNHICMDSEKESELMEKYYTNLGIFRSIHDL